jgi:hypothetical protein
VASCATVGCGSARRARLREPGVLGPILRVDVDNRPDLARPHERQGTLERQREAPRHPDVRRGSARCRFGDDPLVLGDRQRHRLLDEHAPAVAERRQARLRVEPVRQRDDDRPHIRQRLDALDPSDVHPGQSSGSRVPPGRGRARARDRAIGVAGAQEGGTRAPPPRRPTAGSWASSRVRVPAGVAPHGRDSMLRPGVRQERTTTGARARGETSEAARARARGPPALRRRLESRWRSSTTLSTFGGERGLGSGRQRSCASVTRRSSIVSWR